MFFGGVFLAHQETFGDCEAHQPADVHVARGTDEETHRPAKT